MSANSIILTDKASRAKAINAIATARLGSRVEVKDPSRTTLQNARVHAMIGDVAKQVVWAGASRSKEAWKDIFTAALRTANHSLETVPGINGGFVMLGMHTAEMTISEASDLIVIIEQFADQHGVVFSEAAPKPRQARAA